MKNLTRVEGGPVELTGAEKTMLLTELADSRMRWAGLLEARPYDHVIPNHRIAMIDRVLAKLRGGAL